MPAILTFTIVNIIACIIASPHADAAETKKQTKTYHVSVSSDQLTKVEALKALLNGKKVYSCQEQELTEKATIRNKKAE
jgi:ABC-type bacteriocin/lantibiotic exporter with double-glycine peptidase domain